MVPMILIFYIPTNSFELFWWILTLFGLYVGFGKERAPLIRYGIALSRLERRRFETDIQDFIQVESSIFCLIDSLFVVMMMASLYIYPVPFLLILYFKYLVKRIYFNDLSPEVFYENWEKAGKISFKIYQIISLIALICLPIFIILGSHR